MLKTAYFSSIATFLATPLYLFAAEIADIVVLGLFGATAVLVALGLRRGP
jgi:hypothetical protein